LVTGNLNKITSIESLEAIYGSPGQMAQHFSEARGVEFDGDSYDENYAEHMKKTIY